MKDTRNPFSQLLTKHTIGLLFWIIW